MAWRSAMGIASGNGAIGRVDNRIKERAVLSLLLVIDPVFSESG